MTSHLQISLNEWDARLIIEALKEMEAKWQAINEHSPDEDEQAEYGNDLVILGETKDKVIEAAADVFGKQIAFRNRTAL